MHVCVYGCVCARPLDMIDNYWPIITSNVGKSINVLILNDNQLIIAIADLKSLISTAYVTAHVCVHGCVRVEVWLIVKKYALLNARCDLLYGRDRRRNEFKVTLKKNHTQLQTFSWNFIQKLQGKNFAFYYQMNLKSTRFVWLKTWHWLPVSGKLCISKNNGKVREPMNCRQCRSSWIPVYPEVLKTIF